MLPTSETEVIRRDELFDAEQAGRYLGTGTRFVRRLIAERRIDYIKLGKYVRLQRSTLDAFIDAGRTSAATHSHTDEARFAVDRHA